jgi:hypothetical protein
VLLLAYEDWTKKLIRARDFIAAISAARVCVLSKKIKFRQILAFSSFKLELLSFNQQHQCQTCVRRHGCEKCFACIMSRMRYVANDDVAFAFAAKVLIRWSRNVKNKRQADLH